MILIAVFIVIVLATFLIYKFHKHLTEPEPYIETREDNKMKIITYKGKKSEKKDIEFHKTFMSIFSGVPIKKDKKK